MKQLISLILLCCSLPTVVAAQIGTYQHGSVVRMHMGDCTIAQHGFMSNFGGPATPVAQDGCPEYTLLGSDVVYLIVGRSSNQFIPLAENIAFHLHKNELLVRVDDAKKEIKFSIKEMMVRSEWDRLQHHIDEQMRAASLHETSQ